MKLSRASAYAVLAVVAIARRQRQDPGGAVQLKDIVAEFQISHEYVAKLLTTLARARILESDRGRGGGFVLRRRASETTVLEIVEAVEGPLQTQNLLEKASGNQQVLGKVGEMFGDTAARLRELLAARTIDQLLD